jgi:hypothetical protein
MEPLFTIRQLVQSVGQFILVVVTNIMVYKSFSEITADNLFQPIMQGLVVALGILGFSRIGPAPSNVEVTVQNVVEKTTQEKVR